MASSEKEKIFVFGASGHAKVVIDVIEQQGRYQIDFLADDDPALKGNFFLGYKVLGGKQELLAQQEVRAGIVAIGSNRARHFVSLWLAEQGFTLVSVAHPSAQFGRGVIVGPGSVVMPGAIINSDAFIGANVIINTQASIDHDCVIGDGVHIAPGCTLCGTVTVGAGSFVCAGSTIIPNLTVGKDVTVGAGSTVVSNVADGLTVAGTPAREMKKTRD